MLILSLVLAFLPSIIWLGLFLREDVHPEPRRLIVRVFVAGMLITIPTIALEAVLNCAILGCPAQMAENSTMFSFSSPLLMLPEAVRRVLYIFFGIALVEEVFKYVAVRYSIMRSPHFDEPVDALLYLIVAALGFAAVENAFTVSNAGIQAAGLFRPGGVMVILGARSLSATLLHTLTSGILGYGLARSFFSRLHRRTFLFVGIVVATMVHGTYNGLVGGVLTNENTATAVVSTVVLLILTGTVLLLMLRNVRSLSENRKWRNTGKGAEEIHLIKPSQT